MRKPRRFLVAATILGVCALLAPGAQARLDVSLDAETMTEILATVIPEQVEVPLLGDQTMAVELDDFEVTGFDPTAGENRQGYVLTSVRLRVPQLDLDVPVEPRLSLTLGNDGGAPVFFLTFEELAVPMPVTGPVDIAGFLPRVPVPVDSAFDIEVDRGDFVVHTKLVDIRMGTRNLRFAFDLAITPAE
jgi:hypothetical protein